MKANSITTETILPVESLQRGEFVRRVGKDGTPNAKVYIRGDYDKSTKRYSLDDAEDCNREVFVKRGTRLFVGFAY